MNETKRIARYFRGEYTVHRLLSMLLQQRPFSYVAADTRWRHATTRSLMDSDAYVFWCIFSFSCIYVLDHCKQWILLDNPICLSVMRRFLVSTVCNCDCGLVLRLFATTVFPTNTWRFHLSHVPFALTCLLITIGLWRSSDWSLKERLRWTYWSLSSNDVKEHKCRRKNAHDSAIDLAKKIVEALDQGSDATQLYHSEVFLNLDDRVCEIPIRMSKLTCLG